MTTRGMSLRVAAIAVSVAVGFGQPPARRGPSVVSPQIESDGRVTFRILAPQANTVTITGDIAGSMVPDPAAPAPNSAQGVGGRGYTPPRLALQRGPDGVWSLTTPRPVRPGAWRYTFNVDGVTTVDRRNVNLSPNQAGPQSIVYVPGDFSETRDVPHGALAKVRYVAPSLGNARREMVVYTPPGYERDSAKYPVLYLIHGGGDSPISWSTVGRANDILDNLIAEKSASR